MQRSYRRHLSHQVPENTPLFLTWNLKGALPKAAIERLKAEPIRLERESPQPSESKRARELRERKILFGIADRFLDLQTEGPLHLRDDSAARTVQDSILFGSPRRYELFAWCVMANQVHLVIMPRLTLRKVMQGIKGFTAHEINRLQDEKGRVFWQDESYDHWVRDEEEALPDYRLCRK